MEVWFPFLLCLKKLLSHSSDNEPINGQEGIKRKTKRQGESDKADQHPEKNLPALDGGEAVKKVRIKNREEKDAQGR
jgi:hypothetical protein